MPDSLAGFGVQGKQAVGEEVVSKAVCAVEIECCRAGWGIDDAAFTVECHAGPVVGCATLLPGVFGPGVISEFAGMGNGVERPAQFAGANVISADVAGRGRQSFRIASTHNKQVFVDHSGAG